MFQKFINAKYDCQVVVVKFPTTDYVYLDLIDNDGEKAFVALSEKQAKKVVKALKKAFDD